MVTAFRGGGNTANPNMDLSKPLLRWMEREARLVGLRTAPFQRANLTRDELIPVNAPRTGWRWQLLKIVPFKRKRGVKKQIKESLKWYWWTLEIFPFKRPTFTQEGINQTTHWSVLFNRIAPY